MSPTLTTIAPSGGLIDSSEGTISSNTAGQSAVVLVAGGNFNSSCCGGISTPNGSWQVWSATDPESVAAQTGFTLTNYSFKQYNATYGVTGIDPGYEQKHFDAAGKRGTLRLVASPDGRDGSVKIHADAAMYAGLFDGAESIELPLDPKRRSYVHLVRGRLVPPPGPGLGLDLDPEALAKFKAAG